MALDGDIAAVIDRRAKRNDGVGHAARRKYHVTGIVERTSNAHEPKRPRGIYVSAGVKIPRCPSQVVNDCRIPHF